MESTLLKAVLKWSSSSFVLLTKGILPANYISTFSGLPHDYCKACEMKREYDNLKNTWSFSIGNSFWFFFFYSFGFRVRILDSGRVTFLFLENQIYKFEHSLIFF